MGNRRGNPLGSSRGTAKDRERRAKGQSKVGEARRIEAERREETEEKRRQRGENRTEAGTGARTVKSCGETKAQGTSNSRVLIVRCS